MKQKVKRFNYKNATKFKLNNKRIIVEQIENGLGFSLVSLNLQDNYPPHLFSSISKGVRVTNFALSTESAAALYFALQSQLTLNDVTDFANVCDDSCRLRVFS